MWVLLLFVVCGGGGEVLRDDDFGIVMFDFIYSISVVFIDSVGEMSMELIGDLLLILWVIVIDGDGNFVLNQVVLFSFLVENLVCFFNDIGIVLINSEGVVIIILIVGELLGSGMVIVILDFIISV